MIHVFNYKTHHYIYDTGSASLHECDQKTAAYLKAREQGVAPALSAEDIKSISADVETLEGQGLLNAPEPSVYPVKSNEVKALCIHICHDCNMRCRYCFADEGAYHSAREFMSEQTAEKAIDFLIANSGNRKVLEADFFGGEPLMCLGTIKNIVAYAREQGEKYGKKFLFTTTTNGLALGDEATEFFNSEMENVVLSLDGRKEVHNRMRPTPSGKDVYDIIRKNALYMAKPRGNKSYYVRGTFTHENLDFAEDVKAMVEAGFDSVSVEPVVTDLKGIEISESDLPKICEEYDKLARYYLERYDEGKPFTFFHYFIDLETSPCMTKRLTGCGSGCEYVAVSPEGKIYPCHQFCEQEQYCMGDVRGNEGVPGVADYFATNIVTRKKDCENCFAKYYCSGGCAANNIKFGGGMDSVTPVTCAMMKKRLENALFISAYQLTKE